MNTVNNIKNLIDLRQRLERPIGFIPTMGYLHEGHLSLVKRAKQECASTIVSIYVNPTQFAPTEDLNNYPRNIERDLALLSNIDTDLVWLPDTSEMYPEGFQTWVEVENLTKPLEGQFRPTHFRGVTTIVAKLFNVVQPDKAYFGQKDAQQAIVIKQMVRDLNYPIEIVVCPIVREPDGLAMSSRNTYLSPDERKAATVLYRALKEAEEAYYNNIKDADTLRRIMTKVIQNEPLAKIQYVSCADPQTLVELSGEVTHALLSLAVYIGNTRLIDNVIV